MRKQPCVVCGRPAVEELPCWNCEGSGFVPDKLDAGYMVHGVVGRKVKCLECNGSGVLPYDDKCAPKKKSELIRMGIIQPPPTREVS